MRPVITVCVDGLLNEVRHEAHVPACLVIAATSTLKESSRIGNTLHVYVKEKKWEVIPRDVIDGKESETERVTILRGFSRRPKCKGMCDADSDCTHASLILNRRT